MTTRSSRMKTFGAMMTLTASILCGAAIADAAICANGSGRLTSRETCSSRETAVSTPVLCAKPSGGLIARSECTMSLEPAFAEDGLICASRGGKGSLRGECRASETPVDELLLCASRSGKLNLRSRCRRMEGVVYLMGLPSKFQPTALQNPTGTLNWRCGSDINGCTCDSYDDCQSLQNSGMCEGHAYWCEWNGSVGGSFGGCFTKRKDSADLCEPCGDFCSTSHETADHVFSRPRYGSYRLDWCDSWASNCGKPAADHFCRRHYGSNAVALRYAKESDIGHVTPTLTQTDRGLCNQGFCDGFLSITCRAPATASYLPDLGIITPNPEVGY